MKTGTKVEFKNPIKNEDFDKNNKHFLMYVVEDLGPRVLIKTIVPNMNFNPTRIVRKNELIEVD